MSFTDQKTFVVTEEQCHAPWSGGKDGKYFRCGLCGHKFVAGDKCRWIYMGDLHHLNFMTCEACDGPDVRERRLAWEREAETRFWQLKERT